MSLEDTIAQLGSFGRFQKLQYLLACYASFCCAWTTIVLVYILNVPKHRCRVPALGPDDHWGVDPGLVESFVPPVVPCPPSGGSVGCFHPCLLYGNGTRSNVSEGATEGCTATGHVFDRSEFVDTFASEFGYVCDPGRELTITTLMQSQLIGVLVGALGSGLLSDRFGRKPVLIGAMLLMGLVGMATSLSSDAYSFWVCRFLVGAAVSSTFGTSFVLGMEFIGPSARVHAGFVIEYAYAVGLIAIVGLAYLLRYWRWLNIAVSVLPFFSVLLIWLMEESPRWLISVGRADKAELIVRKAARTNGVQLPQGLSLCETKVQVGSERESFIRVFCSRPIAFMTLNVFLQWWVIALVYYGLSLSSGNLPGDIYLTSCLNACAEIVGYALPHGLAGRLGRRVTHAGSMFLAAGALVSTVFLELFGPGEGGGLDWLLVGLAMLGKLGITSAFGVVFLWTAELYPTGVRQLAVGCASTAGRVGTLLAPFMADMRKFVSTSFGAALSLGIFGCLALLAGAASLLLPETLGTNLPETMEDSRRLAAWRRKASVHPHGNALSKEESNGSAATAVDSTVV